MVILRSNGAVELRSNNATRERLLAAPRERRGRSEVAGDVVKLR